MAERIIEAEVEAKEARFAEYQLRPFGDRILVKRRKVGDKLGKEGIIIAPQATGSRTTDLADIVRMPEFTAADVSLLANKERIIGKLTQKAADGDSDALTALLKFNTFLNIRDLKVGDCVMVSKHVGTTFHTSDSADELTIIFGDDIIAKVEVAE